MAVKGIKGITVEIGGNTTGLQKALGEVNSRSKDLQTELKQVERLLKFDPKNTELLAQRQKLLADSVQVSSDKLNQLKEAQSQVEQQFKSGDIGEEQYRAFQREIQAAEQNLKGFETQLKQCKSPLKDLADGFDNFGNKASNIGNKLMPVSGALAGVAAGAAAMAVNTGKAADDINTLAKQTGLSTEAIQKFQYASDIIDVPLETFTGSLAKLTKNMQGAKNGSKNVIEAFDELGVSFLDSNGQLRNNQDVFNDAIDALGKIENQTQRDALAMQIFGKSAQDLNPLILGGADSLKQMGEEAEAAGLILSQDALDSANAFNDELDILKATAKGTFSQLGVEIGTMLMPFLKELLENVKGFMSWLRGLDEGTLKFIATVGLLVAGIAPLLIAVGKISTGISALISLGTTLALIISGVSTAFKALNLVMLANPIGIVIAAIAALVAAFIYLWNTNEDFRNFWIEVWTNISEFFTETLNGIISFGTEIMNNLSNMFSSGLLAVKNLFISLKDGVVSIFTSLSSSIRSKVSGIVTTIKDGLQSAMDWISNLPDQMWNFGANMIEGLIDGIASMLKNLKKMIRDVADTIKDGISDALDINSPSKEMKKLGAYATEGLALGLESEVGKITSVMDHISGIVNTLNTESAAGTYNTYNTYNTATPSSNITFGSLITVQGNIDSSNVARVEKAVKDGVKQLQDMIKSKGGNTRVSLKGVY
jgi:phage-related minor tail protein